MGLVLLANGGGKWSIRAGLLAGAIMAYSLWCTDKSLETKTITEVDSRPIVAGAPMGIDVYTEHSLTFDDGSCSIERTRDYDWPLIKLITGYKTPHPQIGNRRLVLRNRSSQE